MGTGRSLAFCALISAGILGLAGSWHAGSRVSGVDQPSQLPFATAPVTSAQLEIPQLPTANSANESPKARLVRNMLQSPMSFEVNQGQTDSRVKFLSRGSGYTLFLTSSEAVLALNTANARLAAQGQNAPWGFGSNPGNPLSVGYLDRTPARKTFCGCG